MTPRCRLGLFLLALPALAGFGAVKRAIPPAPEQIEAELLQLINRERRELGRALLAPHPVLQEIARGHSARMAAAGELSHTFPGWPRPEEEMQRRGLCFLASSENIARGRSPAARFIHEALMASVMHRINILDERMRQAGIGVFRSGDDYYVSEEFAAIIDCPAAEEATALIENALCRWFKDRLGRPPVVLAEARERARVSAQMHLLGIPFALEPFSERRMRGITVSYNDLGVILSELKKAAAGDAVQALAVGVVWGRNAGSPGGTYSVCLLLFD